MLVAQSLSAPGFELKQRYPVATLAALDSEHRLGDRMLTTDAWADYVIYKYSPQQHVFFDDRYDMYPVAMVDVYDTILNLDPGWERLLDQYRINLVVWPNTGALVQGLAHLPGPSCGTTRSPPSSSAPSLGSAAASLAHRVCGSATQGLLS